MELNFGFAEKPDVPAALAAHAEEVGFDPATASFFLGRETPRPVAAAGIPNVIVIIDDENVLPLAHHLPTTGVPSIPTLPILIMTNG